jgi:hypothetical protein
MLFENRVPRRIFGSRREEVTGDWRKLHNEELHTLCSSPHIIRTIKSRRMKWAGHVARMGAMKSAYRVYIVKSEGKSTRRHRHRWEDNIKMELRDIVFGEVDWIHLAQYRDRWRSLVNTVIDIWVP